MSILTDAEKDSIRYAAEGIDLADVDHLLRLVEAIVVAHIKWTGAYVCEDCGAALHTDAKWCLECARDRAELAAERDREWHS